MSGVDRRSFLAGGTGAFVCTLVGQKAIGSTGGGAAGVSGDALDSLRQQGFTEKSGQINYNKLASAVPTPPRARAAWASSDEVGPKSAAGIRIAAGRRREYWIQAERARWTIVPTRRDEMFNKRVAGKTTFTAFVYRAYSPGFGKPIGPAAIPGPTLEADVGDTLVVNFRNALTVPVTMHPHGVFYRPDADGAYKGEYTDPGGFVKPGKTFQYVWDCPEQSVGVWPYHEHGPLDLTTLPKGLFGAISVRDPSLPQPDVQHLLFLHQLTPPATGLEENFQCINGRAYTGNTPLLRSKVGQRVSQHVIGMDNNFHTYHLHGHRWKTHSGEIVDNQTVGPGDVIHANFTEDNPGRWFYHCHVFSHLHEMSGWYFVDP